jgi:hypothetical protein
MLRVRVLVQPLAGGEAQTIWDRPVTTRREDGMLKDFRELSWDTQKFGERMEMRFEDGAGSHCRVDARFHGAQISPIAGGHQVELVFSGDNWRVW